MRLIYGAAQGLEYLHFNGIIHGNVKCANILVSKEGEARLCDFGMSKVIEDVTERSVSATLSAGDSARWTAPELVLEGKGPSTEADTYSFAMAILELLTKKRPYPECRSTPTVIYRFVVENKPPSRPIEHWMTDVLWDLLCRCWQMDASSRPTMDEVSPCIQTMLTQRQMIRASCMSDFGRRRVSIAWNLPIYYILQALY
ncbi:kinase-like protein [Agrocybe pediades]|nr:kinase-like protein [Agrocybe pediades]